MKLSKLLYEGKFGISDKAAERKVDSIIKKAIQSIKKGEDAMDLGGQIAGSYFGGLIGKYPELTDTAVVDQFELELMSKMKKVIKDADDLDDFKDSYYDWKDRYI